MPYASIAALPPPVRKALPAHAQEIYRAAFNSALKAYGNEQRAAAVAWAAVKRKFKKNADGKWVAKQEGREAVEAREFHEAVKTATDVRVDRESRTLYGVAVLGPRSVNRSGGTKYDWSREAMESAIPLIDGLRVYVNHKQERDRFDNLKDLVGTIANPRFDPDANLVRADIAVRACQHGDQLLTDAEKNPGMTGFSLHHKSYHDLVANEIRKMAEAYRVDWVANPSSTHGMFEAVGDEEESLMDKVKVEDISPEWLRENVPDVVAEIVAEEAKSHDKPTDDGRAKELQADNERLRKEAAALTLKIEQFEARDKNAERAKQIADLLEKHKIPEKTQKALLPVLEAQESVEHMEAIVAEVAELARSGRTMSQESGRGNDQTSDAKTTKAVWDGR